jgi:hypothetical protein
MSNKLIICLVFAALVSNVWGWTFINANTGNTYRPDAPSDPNWWNTAGWDGTPAWRMRTGFGMGNGDTIPGAGNVVDGDEIYQSIDSGETGVDAYTLATDITGLDSGEIYAISVLFWSDEHSSPWTIRAALTAAGLNDRLYTGYPPGPSGPTTPQQVGLDSAGRVLWLAIVGFVTGVSGTTVFIDDLPTDDSNQRTWYDGVAYMEVPEPMTIALLGLGGLLLRRRK